MMMESRKIWLNPKQLSFLGAKQKDRTWIGGRGTGKSVCIGGSSRQKMADLPRAKGFFSSSTYNQILTKTLPPIEDFWQSCGLFEYKGPREPGHYVIGKKPPIQWQTPFSKPRKFENVITFFNGFTIEMLSMDRPDLARGGSYDFGEIDESLIVPKEHIDKILIPSLRGNTHRFSHWSHQQLSKYTSMPWNSKGQYLLEYEDKAKLYPKDYYYQESTAWDNVAILTEAGIRRMEQEMDHLTFLVEVLNHRITRGSHPFYNKFDDKVHTYRPRYIYGEGERGIVVIGNADRKKDRLIDTSWDFSGWFKCCTVWQEDNRTENMIDRFYKNQDGNVTQVVDDLCIAYADQGLKHVRIWGEPRGHDLQATGGTIYDQIKSRFQSNGWKCEIMATAKRADYHELRYEFINEIFEETNARLPRVRINEDTCKEVIISLNNAEIDHQFKKVKKDEKNRSFNQAHATHFTDTVDYYLWDKYHTKATTRALPGRGSNRVA